MMLVNWKALERIGAALLIAGASFVPLSLFLRATMVSSVGQGEDTGKVFVPKSSEAARRGYALPGEGTRAVRIGSQLSRSDRVLAVAAAGSALGLLLVLITSARQMAARETTVGAGIKGIFGAFFVCSLIGGFYGGILSFFIFAPLKAVAEAGFNVLFFLLAAAVMIGLPIHAARKKSFPFD